MSGIPVNGLTTPVSSIKISTITPPVSDSLASLAASSPHLPSLSNPLLNALWRSSERIHQIGMLDRETKKFRNIPVNSVADAIVRALALSENGTESYFACAEYQTADSRVAANVTGAYGFWLDLDCGDEKAAAGKGYQTVEDAESDLIRFCEETLLPEPTHIVHSGGGLHGYWALDALVAREMWQHLAGMLKALTMACKLLADDSRTSDIASVLRVPGTLNYKYTPPKPVTLVFAADKLTERSVMLTAIEVAHARLCHTLDIRSPRQQALTTLTSKEASSRTIAEIIAMLDTIDPDMGRNDWLHVGMAIFHETGGSEEGFNVWDAWSSKGSKGSKYDGEKGLLVQWRSFKLDLPNPVTIATIRKLVTDSGNNWIEICAAAEPDFEPCETVVIVSGQKSPDTTVKPAPSVHVVANPLDKYSLRGRSGALEKLTVAQVPILGQIALKGQSTIYYASPNTGKTLITLSLIIDGIKNGSIDPSKLYYLNMDDNGPGLLTKLRLAEEYGFHMLAEGHREFKISDFLSIVAELVENDQCRDVIIVLDTLKKFVDLMDKGRGSSFTKVIRRFIVKGGTHIALAHTNKNPGRDGKPIYSGTTDIIDDSDCAYTLAKVASEAASGEKVVEFENIKRRGNVVQTAAYSYTLEPGISYEEILLSVSPVDPLQLVPLKQAEAIKSDVEVIEAALASIRDGINTKMRLADSVADRAKISKRSALKLIDKYTGSDPTIHRWTFSVHERGAKVFCILESTTPKISQQSPDS